MSILALNIGSSSLKFSIGEPDEAPQFTGEADGFGGPSAKLEISDSQGTVCLRAAPASLTQAGRAVLDFAGKQAGLDAIGHRFVHGGPDLTEHRLIDAAVRGMLRAASAFAPLHNPPALEVLALAEAAFSQLPQVACLDTAFHAAMPEAARRFALPPDRLGKGVRRYGFHGLSCESVVSRLAPVPEKLVIAHLGGGASVTAVRAGRSADTSMGLTPDGGVMMETRSGDLDPGLLLYLLRHGETTDSLESLLNRESGLAGVSGHGGDLRAVRAGGDAASCLALEMFETGIAKAIAGMATVLGGLDMLIFTGGIGWHDAATRQKISARLDWLGSITTRAMPAEEETVILRHTRRLSR